MIAYDFVDVVRATGFPWVNFLECVSLFAEPDSRQGGYLGQKGMTF